MLWLFDFQRSFTERCRDHFFCERCPERCQVMVMSILRGMVIVMIWIILIRYQHKHQHQLRHLHLRQHRLQRLVNRLRRRPRGLLRIIQVRFRM